MSPQHFETAQSIRATGEGHRCFGQISIAVMNPFEYRLGRLFSNPVRFSDQTMVYTRKKQSDAAAVLLLVQNPARYTHKNGL